MTMTSRTAASQQAGWSLSTILASSLLAGSVVLAVPAFASPPLSSGTWTGTLSGELSTGGNWSGAVVPSGTGTFTNNGAPTNISVEAPVTIGTLQFDAGSPAFTFNLPLTNNNSLNDSLIVNGAGVVNNSSNPETFNVSWLQSGTGNNIIYGGGALVFQGAATSANSIINNTHQLSYGVFYGTDTATAGTSIITNTAGGGVQFYAHTTAAQSQISANTGYVGFADSATAAQSTITLTAGATLTFSGSATAGSAAITSTGSTVTFSGNSTGGTASIANNAGSTLDFSYSQGPNGDNKLTIGSITGTGTINLGGNQLTIGGNNQASSLGGVITAVAHCSQESCTPPTTPGSIVKIGTGTLTLNAANAYTGLTDVQTGMLVVGDSSHPGASVSGPVTIENGASLGGYGTIIGLLTNDGVVQPGDDPGTLTITGNYVQGSNGELLVTVTPTIVSLLKVSGTATLAGNVTFAYAPGTYSAGTFPIVTAAGGLSGTFGTKTSTGSVPSIAQAVTYTSTAANLVLGSGTSTAVVSPSDGSLFNAQDSVAAIVARDALTTLMAVPEQACNTTIGERPQTAYGPLSCQGGFWIQEDAAPISSHGSASTASFNAMTAHSTVGYDRPVLDTGARLGGAVGYDQTWMHDGVGSTANQQTVRLSMYGAMPAGPLVLNAALSYGLDTAASRRATGVGGATESHNGNEFAGGAQASLPVPLGGLLFTPRIGVQLVDLHADSFTESATGNASSFGVAGNSANLVAVTTYVHASLSSGFVTASQYVVQYNGEVGYDYQGGSVSPTVQLTAQDGTSFISAREKLARGSAALGLGVSVGRGNWSVYAGYKADVASNWTGQNVRVGLRLVF